jgi:hypothetical protein
VGPFNPGWPSVVGYPGAGIMPPLRGCGVRLLPSAAAPLDFLPRPGRTLTPKLPAHNLTFHGLRSNEALVPSFGGRAPNENCK